MSEMAVLLSTIGITSVIWIDDQFAPFNVDRGREQLKAFVKTSVENDIELLAPFVELKTLPPDIVDVEIDSKIASLNNADLEDILTQVKQNIQNKNPSLLPNEEFSAAQFRELREGMSEMLQTFSFADWNSKHNDILSTDHARTLFLVDREAINENLGHHKGDEIIAYLSQNIRTKDATCLLLTHTVTPSDADGLRQTIATPESGIPPHYFSVMSKKSISGESDAVVEFKRALRAVFVSRTCRELTEAVITTIKDNLDDLSSNIAGLAVDDIDAAIFKSSETEGCMEIEVIERIIRAAQHSALLSEFAGNTTLHEKLRKLAGLRYHHEAPHALDTLSNLPDKCSHCPKSIPCHVKQSKKIVSTTQSMKTFKKWRQDEVFLQGDLVNKLHYSLDCGDVFAVFHGKTSVPGKKRYVLIAQPCNLMIRPDGKRKQREAIWAEIVTQEPVGLSSCFIKIEGAEEDGTDWFVDFRHTAFVNLKVLDYAVFSDDGSIALKKNITTLNGNLSPGISKLFEEAKRHLQNGMVVSLALSIPNGSQKVQHEEVRFPYKRIGRINQPWAHAILAAFAAYHTRMALDHNFAREPATS